MSMKNDVTGSKNRGEPDLGGGTKERKKVNVTSR